MDQSAVIIWLQHNKLCAVDSTLFLLIMREFLGISSLQNKSDSTLFLLITREFLGISSLQNKGASSDPPNVYIDKNID